MPIIRFEEKAPFHLEPGQEYCDGWVFVRAEHHPNHSIGTHTFVFFRNSEVRRVTNERWRGENTWATDGKFGNLECPNELKEFAYRTTRVIDDRQTARAED